MAWTDEGLFFKSAAGRAYTAELAAKAAAEAAERAAPKQEAKPAEEKSTKGHAEKLNNVIKPNSKEDYRLNGLLTPAYKSCGM